MDTIKKTGIEYLTFEGGGGKGLVYLGPLTAIQEKLKAPSIIDINQDISDRKIKGISGTSAGAITAFMVAIGMSRDDIDIELKTLNNSEYYRLITTIDALGDNFLKNFIPTNTNELNIARSNIAETFLNDNSEKVRSIERVRRGFNYSNYDERLDDTFIKNRAPGFIVDHLKKSNSFIDDQVLLKLLFTGRDKKERTKNSIKYLNNLLYHRGIFSGTNVIKFFSYLITKYVIEKKRKSVGEFIPSVYNANALKTDPERMTFSEFFNLTGTDLIIAGTNVSQKRPLYFSLYHTPEFPVVYAVALSMNLPVIFKPIYIDFRVHNKRDREYNDRYSGHFVDGGMLNNLPIHAFNKIESESVKFNGINTEAHLGANTYGTDQAFSEKVIGFMIGDNEPNDKPKPTKWIEEFPTERQVNVFSYLMDLFGVFMFPGSQGRIRSTLEDSYTIELDSSGLNLIDFSHPENDIERAKVFRRFIKQIQGSTNTYSKREALRIFSKLEEQFRENAKNKYSKISSAYIKTSEFLKDVSFPT